MIFSRIGHRINLLWERIIGVDFSSIIPVNELGLDPLKVYHGSSSGGRALEKVFIQLGIKDTDNILDIGCGKGGAFLTLYKFPFSRIDGVEISQELSNIADLNVRKLKMLKTKIYNCNALEFEQYQSYNFYYIYNPFDCQSLNKVLSEIIKTSRKKVLIYNNPVFHKIVTDKGFVQFLDAPSIFGNRIYGYTYNPSST